MVTVEPNFNNVIRCEKTFPCFCIAVFPTPCAVSSALSLSGASLQCRVTAPYVIYINDKHGGCWDWLHNPLAVSLGREREEGYYRAASSAGLAQAFYGGNGNLSH